MNIYTKQSPSVSIKVWPALLVAVLFFTNAWSGTDHLRVKQQGQNPAVSAKQNNLLDPITATPTIVDRDSCSLLDNGSISLLVNGGSGSYTYLWSNGALTASVSNLPVGSYTVTISDGIGSLTETYSVALGGGFTYYFDADGDGYGLTSSFVVRCNKPSGYAVDDGDCNDTNANVNSDEIEVCGNGIDDNCNGNIDGNDPALTVNDWYKDADLDGYGAGAATSSGCPPTGFVYVLNNTDCDDGSSTVNPGATEVCNGIDDNCIGGADEGVTLTFYRDTDGDGFGNASVTIQDCYAPVGYVSDDNDCNDNNAAIRPNATEVCNGIDDDCDSNIDDADSDIADIDWYVDSDNDGYGDASATAFTAGCQPSGYVSNNDDCNDGAAGVKPGAPEVCNTIDDNCSGVADEGVTLTWYRDADGDSYGDPAVTTEACYAPVGYLGDNNDCNDASAAINPGAAEVCNSIDDDCDGLSDNVPTTTYYADVDGDGYGDLNFAVQFGCNPPATGYALSNGDCNDNDPSLNPGATEICNNVDDDCDGSVDPGLQLTWYRDVDGDSYGDVADTAMACYAPPGFVGDNNDCNDNNSAINPGATEICNTIDDDCDGNIDNVTPVTYYADTDNDGFGDNNFPAQVTCTPLSGYVLDNSDCNDGSAAVYPGATESCNGIDDNCDTQSDEGLLLTWYADVDGDGFGDNANTVDACYAPLGYLGDNNDCNDNNAAVNPNAAEVCNTIDDDCNGMVDDVAPVNYYVDSDGDGYGDINFPVSVTCTVPPGYVADDSDCNDGMPSVNPGATEICNTIDDDCDGSVDEGVQTLWYADADGDTYGDVNSSASACYAPPGYVGDNNDCDDNNAAVNPGATEVCDGIDNDCDGNSDNVTPTVYYADGDGDTYGDNASSINIFCGSTAGYVLDNSDCDDGNASVNPAATEVCNSIDDDCDTFIDEGLLLTWYADADGDTYGNVNVTTTACYSPPNYVGDNNDCDDNNAAVNPAAAEVCDGIDNDCDGNIDNVTPTTWYADGDGDTYGDPLSSISVFCGSTTGYVLDNTDCDDGNAAVNPAATEVCNLLDDDCDTQVDEGVKLTWYVDTDGDGYGNPAVSTLACTLPIGYVADNTDCNDADFNINPSITEVCNGIDDDCDSLYDFNDPSYADNINPVANCQNLTIYLNAAGSASITAAQINNGSSDNCQIGSLALDQTSFGCSNVGANTVTLTVTDLKGNIATCTATVTVLDTIRPVATCQNITVQLDATGNVGITAAQVNNGSSDACNIASLTVSPNSFTCTNIGANTVTLTVVDNNGNTSTCTSQVTVQDNVAPAIQCKDITVQLNAAGTVSIDTASVTLSASDACGIFSRSIDISSFTCANIGGNTVTLTVVDNNNNTSTCTSQVTVQDNVAPAIQCKDITVQLNAAGTVSIDTASVTLSASDACGIISRSIDISSFTCANIGGNTVTLTVVDNNGNTSTCTSQVMVQDNVAPSIQCKDITVQLNAAGTVSIDTASVTLSASDACGIFSRSIDISSFTCANIGGNTVTLTVVDNNNNTSTCTSIVTVQDNVAPAIQCKDITVQLNAAGTVSIDTASVTLSASDACGIFSRSIDISSFTCANIGGNTVTLTVVDNNGNTSTCTATVTVQDNVAPVTPTIAPVIAECSATITAPTTTDNCAGTVTGTTSDPTTYSAQGAYTITWTFTDAYGNSTTATQSVTIDDVTAPVTPTLADVTGECSATATAPTTTDNCSGTITGTTSDALTYSTQGTYTITWSFNDGNGNVTTATQSVIVDDVTAPVTPTLADVTGECSATATAPTTTDNCSGTITGTTSDALTYSTQGTYTITWSFNDGNGNVSTATQSVIVDDVTAPAVPTLADVTGECSATATAPTTTDNCSGTITGTTSDALTYSTQGTYTITWSFNDGNGNVSTATQSVIVDDVTAPAVPTLADVTGECSATATAPTTTDNCSGTITGTTSDALTYSTQGTYTITWNFNDGNGNVTTATQSVIVDDVTAPVAPTLTAVIGQCSATVTAPTATDNCAGTITGTTTDPLTYSAQGTYTITWSFNDGNGNVTTATQNVIVNDMTPPVVSGCPSDVTQCENIVTWTAPTATDNCSIVSSNASHNPGDVFPVGTTSVTYTFMDVGGNIATCTFNVTITPGNQWYADADADGYGNPNVSQYACTQPSGYVTDNSDCNDANAAINPAATEICNGVDDNCDGTVDVGVNTNVSAINGVFSQCLPISNGSGVFSVTPNPNVATYSWAVPAGMIITSGQGTPTITVAWTTTSIHDGILGDITLTPSNACGQGAAVTAFIDYNYTVPVRASSISGPTKLCPGETATFSVLTIARAVTYSWTVPAGMTIISGHGTNVINVAITGAFTGGSVSVVGINVCGTGPIRSKTVSYNLPGAPTAISGPTSGLCGASGVVYTTTGTVGTTSFNWTVPAGMTIVSGQGTSSIIVNVGSVFTTGSISVTGVNNCGSGLARSITVTGAPGIATPISGPVNICPGATGLNYSVSTVAGALNYLWSVPSGVTIVGSSNGKSITVNYGNNPATNQVMSVRTSNGCGLSPIRLLSGITINSVYCPPPRMSDAAVNMSQVGVFPNPATDQVTVQFNLETGMDYRIRVVDALSRTVYMEEGEGFSGMNSKRIAVDQLTGGIYFVIVETGKESQITRLMIE